MLMLTPLQFGDLLCATASCTYRLPDLVAQSIRDSRSLLLIAGRFILSRSQDALALPFSNEGFAATSACSSKIGWAEHASPPVTSLSLAATADNAILGHSVCGRTRPL